MNIFVDEHVQVLQSLLRNNVSFILIGGYAVIHYGYSRTTGDMDIWLQLGTENKNNLLKALAEFGIESDDLNQLEAMDFTKPMPVFFIGEAPRRIDFITAVNNIRFEEAITEVNYFPVEDIRIPVIQYQHLLLTKSGTSRAKDLADIEELKRINKYRDQS
ncbi:MAG: nucleotidyltransferase [Sediminibacterium sp.]|uniref:nucleotidyltransferase n=1 Tax=Sediminibacterium sp. TaxID=1917865 RepID=UPI002728DC41|nr:nucleotidyltransferase [Sediminibacterium sp.]MDO8995958.1 nucleotidyltransferase [Sediminibacterium sp.]